MRLDLLRFFESIHDENVIAWMILYMNSEGLHQLFNTLDFSDDDTRKRWEKVYLNRFEYALTDAKNRGVQSEL